jgi:hypothetical protein
MLSSPATANFEDDSLILNGFSDRSWIDISILWSTIGIRKSLTQLQRSEKFRNLAAKGSESPKCRQP